MKRKVRFLLALLIIAFACVCACYSYNEYPTGDFLIIKIVPGGEYTASVYYWDGSDEGKTLTIPDECDGHAVTRIGAESLLCPFLIDMPDEYNGGTACTGSVGGVQSTSAQLYFTVIIGKNVEILDSYLDSSVTYQTESGGYIEYCFNFYFECSDENKKFYAKDGVMYNKSDDSPIDWVC